MIAINERSREATTIEDKRWKLVASFETYEPAEAALRGLRDRGIESTIAMIDGLSVLKRD